MNVLQHLLKKSYQLATNLTPTPAFSSMHTQTIILHHHHHYTDNHLRVHHATAHQDVSTQEDG